MAEQFKCMRCRQVFEKGWSDEEADAEYRSLFPNAAASEAPRSIVCDDCFNEMTKEYPPDQYEKDQAGGVS